MEITFKSGLHTLEKHIPYIEANLGKVRLTREGETEGIWVMFSEEDKKKYDNDELNGEEILAVLCNQSLAGVPWGAYIKVTLEGVNRPTCVCEEVFGDNPTFVYADWASASICDNILKNLQDKTYSLEQEGLRDRLILHVNNAPESDTIAALKALLEQ